MAVLLAAVFPCALIGQWASCTGGSATCTAAGVRVGIGTASPAGTLDIAGSSAANTFTAPADQADLRVLSSNNRPYDGGIIEIGGIWGATGYIKTQAFNGTAGAMTFGTKRNPTDTALQPTLILDSNGQVGMGVLPQAPLDLGYQGSVRQLVNGGGANLGYYMGFGVDSGQAPNTFSLFMGPPNGDGVSGPTSLEVVSANSQWPYSGYTTRMTVLSSGAVGIGTVTPCANGGGPGNCLLAVKGGIEATEIMVTNGITADYVFAPGYRLAPLNEVAEYVKANHHLPEIPSAAEVAEKGVNLGDMQAKLLAKIEELTLHMIQAEERAERLEKRNSALEQEMTRIRIQAGGSEK